MDDAPVPVYATEECRGFFGVNELASVTNARFVVNRAPLSGQCERVMIDSRHGPLLGGMSLGGKGMLWRVGTTVPRRGLRC